MITNITIVIHAYNEQSAIATIIERSLSARDVIVDQLYVDEVEIIGVSDNSTDHTIKIASEYNSI